MKRTKLILLFMMIIPWSTLPLLGRKTFIRYLPASLFITILSKVIDKIAQKRTWWWFYHRISPLKAEDPLTYGPYFATSFWILKMTYGKFGLYLITNILLHLSYIFFGLNFLKRWGIFSLVRMQRFQYFIYHLSRALVLYAFQYIKESLFKGNSVKEGNTIEREQA